MLKSLAERALLNEATRGFLESTHRDVIAATGRNTLIGSLVNNSGQATIAVATHDARWLGEIIS